MGITVYLDVCCFKRPFDDATLLWLDAAKLSIASSPATANRALELTALGFSALDGLHIAFAEGSAARWFVTTDDRLMKLASRHRDNLRVEVLRPDQLVTEGVEA